MSKWIDWAVVWLVAANLLAWAITAFDKTAARRGWRRVPERTLFLVAALGGTPAMLLTMYTIRHKTRHLKFMVGLPLLLAAQAAVAVLLLKCFS